MNPPSFLRCGRALRALLLTCLVLTGLSALAQTTTAYQWSTLAGTPPAVVPVDGSGSAVRFVRPGAMAADAAGNLYVADYGSIRKITPAGTVSTFVGLVDGKSLFTFIDAMAADAAGNLYVADYYAIKKVSPSGEISLLAGQVGVQGCVDGTGAAARFNYFDSMVVDSSGNLFVIDGNNCIVRKVTAAGGGYG